LDKLLAPDNYVQGCLHHINDGANAPWKKHRGRLWQELRGKWINFLYKIKDLSYWLL